MGLLKILGMRIGGVVPIVGLKLEKSYPGPLNAPRNTETRNEVADLQTICRSEPTKG
jgi:hypothetical protein